MTKYRKKPIEIEAIQFTGDNFAEIQEFTGNLCSRGETYMNPQGYCMTAYFIRTLQDSVAFFEGDYIIKGTHDCYPCNEKVFIETYERVKE